MRIETYALPEDLDNDAVKGKTVIVLDILRATTNMVFAFHYGVKRIIPVVTIEEALAYREQYPAEEILLGGERNRVKIPGFDLANSPWEYQDQIMKNKTIVMTTTNGTKAIAKAKLAKHILIGSFLNITAIIKKARDLSCDVVILCAGTKGRFSLEDSLAASYLIQQFSARGTVVLDDLSLALQNLYTDYATDLPKALALSENGKALIALQKDADLLAAAQLDFCTEIPYWKEGKIEQGG